MSTTSRPVARNKSSSQLSTTSSNTTTTTVAGKPKRNKSAASLHHHHHQHHHHGPGHHNVTFVSSSQRRQSHGHHEQQHRRPSNSSTQTAKKQHSSSSELLGMTSIPAPATSSEAAAAAEEDASIESIGRALEEKSNPLESYVPPEGQQPPSTNKHAKPTSSSVVTNSSGWESAQDSPMVAKKALPSMTLTTTTTTDKLSTAAAAAGNEGAPQSGLGQVIQAGVQNEPEQQDKPTSSPVRPPSSMSSASVATRRSNKPKFDLHGSPPSPEQSMRATLPSIPQGETMSSPPSRSIEKGKSKQGANSQSKAARRKPSDAGSMLSIASTRSNIAALMNPGPSSPSSAAFAPPPAIRGVTSSGGGVGRRVASGSAPLLDRQEALGISTSSSSAASSFSARPQRDQSSLRAQDNRDERRPSPSRSQSGPSSHPAAKRLAPMARSNSVAELQRIAGAAAAAAPNAPPKRSNSGYFSALKGLAGGFTSITGSSSTTNQSAPAPSPPPLSQNTAAGTLNTFGQAARTLSSSGLSSLKRSVANPVRQGSQQALLQQQQQQQSTASTLALPPEYVPVVSKFVDQDPYDAPSAVTVHASSAPSTSNAAAAPARAMRPLSRTEQKALLARDAPAPPPPPPSTFVRSPQQMHQSISPAQQQPSPPSSQPHLSSQQQQQQQQQRMLTTPLPPPPARSSSASAEQMAEGMQKWSIGLVREAERIDRQFRAVQRTRDPVRDSVLRVLNASSSSSAAGPAGEVVQGGKGSASSSSRVLVAGG